MAAYQFGLNVIPRKGVLEKFGYVPERLEVDFEERKNYYHLKKDGLLKKEGEFKDALTQDWWSSTELQPIEIIRQIDKIVARRDEHNNCVFWKTYLFSKLDNDAFMSINAETGKIEELLFRADLGEENLKFLKDMVGLAKEYDWLLMDLNGNLANPEIQGVFRLAKISNAFKFVQNPLGFLADLNNEDIQI
ncbi:MAG: hypothetical protein ACK4Q5_12185 [Saprospiraceae bacterium]